MKKEFNNIMENLKWAAGLSDSTFGTMLSNAIGTGNTLFTDWLKNVTGKKQVYSGGRDWPEIVLIVVKEFRN